MSERTCGQCGAVVRADDRFCGECGAAAEQLAVGEVPETPGKADGTENTSAFGRIPGWAWVATASLAVVVVVVIVVLSGSTSNDDGAVTTDRSVATRASPQDEPEVAPPTFEDVADVTEPPTAAGPAPTAPPTLADSASAVTTGGVVIRTGPSTGSAQVGSVAAQQLVEVSCAISGEYIVGPDRSTSEWYYITTSAGDRGYASAAYIAASGPVDDC